MSSEIVEKYFIFNNNILGADETDKLPLRSSGSIYEVIRVISGVPLFLEKHIDRLEASAGLLGHSVQPLVERIKAAIKELIEINNKPGKNIKIIVSNLSSKAPDYVVFFIESSYPEQKDYQSGVPTVLYKAERNNPNAKVVNLSFKEGVASVLKETNAYEALLVNENNEITEGSRSNVFFVKGESIYTSPKGAVLVGITRVSVFELCSRLNINIIERPIDVAFLNEIDGLFMTGTSPKILP
ncbi:MAG: aminotransferase class IV, partial [Caulobacteraceae bacterium]